MTEDLVIVGAGISGMTAALRAAEFGLERVVLLDHQKQIGGFTRSYMENEEFHRERRLLDRAAGMPYEVKSNATVVGFFHGENGEPHRLFVQTPAGTSSLNAKRVLIATGSLEKPREAHKIPGTRPAGVMTPSLALELIGRGYTLGEHVTVFVNGRLARSALETIKRTHARVTVLNGASADVVRVRGSARLEAVTVKSHGSGEEREIACDTFVFAKGRYPSTFFLKGVPVERDAQTAIRVKPDGKTSLSGVYAAGSCTCLGDDEHLRSMELAEQAAHSLLQSL